MTQNLSRLQLQQRAGGGFGRMVALSLAVHLTIAILFAADLFPVPRKDLRPLYFVDLVNLPVPDPQAGRPDARPAPEKVQPAPPAAKPEPAVVAKPEATKPAPAMVKPKPAKTAKQPPKPETKPADDYAPTASVIEQMRQRKALEDRLATLKAQRQSASAAPVETPVGEQNGQGKELGASYKTWLEYNLWKQWSYSPYISDRNDLEISFILAFEPNGKLRSYRVIKSSGNRQFDQSVTNAIQKLFANQTLPNPPKERWEIEARFNLKDVVR